MSSDNGFFQHYFTTHRKAPPKRSLTAPFNLWKRSKSTRNSIRSVSNLSLRDSDMDPPTTNLNGSLNHQEPEPTSAFDSEIFRSYLLSLLPPVIGADPSELDSLFDEEFDLRIARFASDTGGVVYVVKVKEETEGMSFYFMPKYNELTFIARRCTSNILLSSYPTSNLSTLTCNDAGPHQTRTNTWSNYTACYATTLSQSLRRGRNTIREPACSRELWC